MIPRDPEGAVSHLVGVLLLVALTILLAALVLLLLQLPSFDLRNLTEPSFLEIRDILHENENGIVNFDSRVILYHNGTVNLNNSCLRAEFYRNGTRIYAPIDTLHGEDFIPTHHNGVQTMGGLGCKGPTWIPGEKISIDFTDNTYRPGDRVRVDIFNKTSGRLVSRSSYLA